jgi:hypothetical protein
MAINDKVKPIMFLVLSFSLKNNTEIKVLAATMPILLIGKMVALVVGK